MIQFELPKEKSSIIKVIGVGGGGSNAVNHMYRQGISGVDFIICNTDKQALDISPVPIKIQLGQTLTQGLGAGSIPEVGKNAAIESIEAIKEILSSGTKMVFITAGMGGGTGTGAAPIVAQACREMGILTVGIVTLPFAFEGKRKRQQAEEGIKNMKQNVDCLLVIANDKLREIYGNLSISNSFGKADDVLSNAAKSIAELISLTKHMNVDFNDVHTAMKDSGVALMGSGTAQGENRAIAAVEQALNSPLLNDNNISGARYVLIDITSGSDELTMDEFGEITDLIQEATGNTADVKIGYGVREELGDTVHVTIIATGFSGKTDIGINENVNTQKTVHTLSTDMNIESVNENKNLEEVNKNILPEQNKNFEEPYLKTIEKPISNDKVESKIDQELSLFDEPLVVNTTIDFEIKKETPSENSETNKEQKIVHVLDLGDTNVNSNDKIESTPIAKQSQEEQLSQIEKNEQLLKAKERAMRLKEFNYRLKTANIADLENVPAYKRRNVTLDNVPHSSESNVSRYTLSENEEKKTEIKPNNSFLHDNVD
ncbi:MAG: cell division protein FtsZ [Bacteroidia bacterium]